ncbi:hypothetical protein CA54_57070 [Symmachiella macrocystis]|uniref:Tll0287-like domain-containing protein n=1 Tax=Symmachiella macrocystis TaxID=2527985 RepID=A0A5C6B752_9PLAN|nr:DUF3365 domain-containing protein [Symmachiella macrocystis]TWU07301.1 hypothetical protein CA54_57070 [Symmachiella macrocystis]
MKQHAGIILSMIAVVLCAVVLSPGRFGTPAGHINAADKAGENKQAEDNLPTTVLEARGRARLLHETIHGALQVVHRDFFLEDESVMIPSQSLEDVFLELARGHHVTLKWLVVNGGVMNVDHKPADAFERNAVVALADGNQEFEATEGNSFRYAGAIRLASRCLKCHVPNRTDTKDRTAGLVISMPLKKPE